VLHVTQSLTDRFVGYPLNPGVGVRWSIYGVGIGLGDVLAFSFFAAATYKAYGREGQPPRPRQPVRRASPPRRRPRGPTGRLSCPRPASRPSPARRQ
jgi:hypothetical protein